MDFLSEEHLEELRQAHEKSPPPPPSAATIALTVLVMILLIGMIAFVISDIPLPSILKPAGVSNTQPEPTSQGSPQAPMPSAQGASPAAATDVTVPAKP